MIWGPEKKYITVPGRARAVRVWDDVSSGDDWAKYQVSFVQATDLIPHTAQQL